MTTRIGALAVALLLSVASVAEARIGGGRSSGMRGSRSFGTRSYQTTPSRPYYGGQQQNYGTQPAQPGRPIGGYNTGFGGGSFTRGLLGGLAGGFIGSMLFRGLGHAGYGGLGGSGFGFLELMLLGGAIYLIYRSVTRRRYASAGGYRGEMSHYEKLHSVEPGPFAAARGFATQDRAPEETLRSTDPSFDPERFKDERMDDFMKLQAAWNHRDLSSVGNLLAPELRRQLEWDIEELKRKRQINKVENIAVRRTELIEAWQEQGQEYVTLRFQANLTDYTVDESTGTIVAGDRVTPVKFEEDWTFVRRPGTFGPGANWSLSAIEA